MSYVEGIKSFIRIISFAMLMATFSFYFMACSKSQSPDVIIVPEPPPLTIQQKADLKDITAGLSDMQIAFYEFGRSDVNRLTTSNNLRSIEENIRRNCQVNVSYSDTPRQLKSFITTGSSCPLDFVFHVTPYGDEGKAAKMVYTYTIKDPAMLTQLPIRSMNLRGDFNLRKSNSGFSNSDASGVWVVTGDFVSNKWGVGSYKETLTTKVEVSRTSYKFDNLRIIELRTQTLQAVLRIESSYASNAMSYDVYLNGEKLGHAEASALTANLPDLNSNNYAKGQN